MRKSIVIGISLLFFIGIISQASARKIHCWDDYIQNYKCDPEEDINEDGKCNVHDCETEEPCYAIQQTGQTLCYDTDGNTIGCAGTGQDGEYQYGTPWPEPRFTNNLDGTVTDHLTRLIWLQNANCIATSYPAFDNDDVLGDGRVTWQHALDFVTDINGGTYTDCGAGYTDWRLPNAMELHSLIDYSNYDPALPSGHPFTGVQHAPYWSSTTMAIHTDYAWNVAPEQGHVHALDKESEFFKPLFVWPVRDDN